MSDRWKPDALGDSPYLFLPMNLAHIGDPLLQWHPSWTLNLKDGTWNDIP